MAGIGASFFLAYVIEATWLAQRISPNARSEELLGMLTGLAVSGLAGVILSLFLGETTSPESLTETQSFYFCWCLVSLGCLGLLVALQPALTHFWIHENDRTPGADGDSG